MYAPVGVLTAPRLVRICASAHFKKNAFVASNGVFTYHKNKNQRTMYALNKKENNHVNDNDAKNPCGARRA